MENLNKYEDEKLVKLINDNSQFSESAFNILYSRFSAKLNSYCLYISESQKDAEEIFQDTWLKFYHSILSNTNIISIPAFLYKIARNLSIDKYRLKKNKIIKNFDDFDLSNFADPSNLLGFIEKDDLMSMISMAVNSLSDIYKETFVLLWFSGLSYSEISQITGVSVENIRMRSYRAMDEVIKILQPVINEITKED